MSERNFNMRLKCRYEGTDNNIAGLEVEHKVDDEWVPLDLGLNSPGFDVFVYAICACQHRFFRVVCAERTLVLDSAEGNILIGAGEDWQMESLRVHFSGQLEEGKPSPEDIDAVVSRMKQCPVSRNIASIPHSESTVTLV